jgi:iron(III) transport system permease protein
MCVVLCALPLFTLVMVAGREKVDFSGLGLSGLLNDTVGLLAGIAILAGCMGTVLGWLVTRFEFPGRGVMEWLALLPFALPGYVVSFLAVDRLGYAGPVQDWLRDIFGWQTPSDYFFPDIRSLTGAVLVMSLILYPYVYVAARSAFLKQPQAQIEAARSLGKTVSGTFFSVELPVALPAISVGVMFALLEALNDIGAAQFFGVQTLTYGIYSLWLGENNLAAAAQLAIMLFLAILVFVFIERRAMALDARYHAGALARPLVRQNLRGWPALLAIACFVVPVGLGFVLPGLTLLGDALPRLSTLGSGDMWLALWHSVLLAVLAALIAVGLGLIVVYGQRHITSHWWRGLLLTGTFGYAIPGTVLALGLMVAFGGFDHWLHGLFGTGLLVSGSITGLTVAYVVRFLALPFRSIETGAKRITPSLDAAGRSLGRTGWQNFRHVHFPLLRPSIVAAALLVFVDAMKELPMTLLMRPFDFNTLATKVFDSASLSQFEDASLPAVIIVLAGLVPVVLLSRQFRQAAFRD